MKSRSINLSELKSLSKKKLRELDAILFVQLPGVGNRRHGAAAVLMPYREYERINKVLYQAQNASDKLAKALKL